MSKDQEFKRFDLTGETDGMRIHIPAILRQGVENHFYERIRYKKGLTLKDAYLYCAQKGIETFLVNRDIFNEIYTTIDPSVLAEDKDTRGSLLTMPVAISDQLDLITDAMSFGNKRKTFNYVVKIGLDMYLKNN